MAIGIFFLTVLFVLVVIPIAVIAFLILMLVSSFISAAHGAPFSPIKRKSIKSLLAWGGLSPDDIFYDLGCGDGRVLISAICDFRVQKAVGYEVAPWPYLETKFAVYLAGLRKDISIFRKDFFEANLSDASFVYTYLSSKLVNEFAVRMTNEVKPGAKILCPSFPIDLANHPSFRLIKSEKAGKMTAYLYEKR